MNLMLVKYYTQIIFYNLELDELDYQMRVELDSNELKVPGKKVLTNVEKDEKELNELLK
jgi:hypothetical protein